MLQAAQHSAIIRKWHSFYLAIAVVSTMQERVDYAIVRGFFRLTMTSIASSIGEPISLLLPLLNRLGYTWKQYCLLNCLGQSDILV